LGKATESHGVDWASVMCQCRTFMRLNGGPSIWRRSALSGRKCRAVSTISPWNGKRGASSIRHGASGRV